MFIIDLQTKDGDGAIAVIFDILHLLEKLANFFLQKLFNLFVTGVNPMKDNWSQKRLIRP